MSNAANQKSILVIEPLTYHEHPDESGFKWCLLVPDAKEPDWKNTHEHLDELNDVIGLVEANKLRTVLLLPPTTLLVKQQLIPKAQLKYLDKITPNLIEEYSVSPIEDLSFTTIQGKESSDSSVNIEIYTTLKQPLLLWKDWLTGQGISVHAIQSASQWYSNRNGSPSLLFYNQDVVFKDSDGGVTNTHADNWSFVLSNANLEGTAELVLLNANVTITNEIRTLYPNLVIIEEPYGNSRFISDLTDDKKHSTLFPQYCSKSNSNKVSKYLIATCLILGMLQPLVPYYLATNYKEKAISLIDENTALFKRSFPSVRKIVNMKTQVKNELSKKSESHSNEFIGLLNEYVTSLTDDKEFELQSLRYSSESQKLHLELTATSIKSYDALLSRMKEQGLTAELSSIDEDDGKTRGRIAITGGTER